MFILMICWVAGMAFFFINWPAPTKKIVLPKERAAEFEQLYTKKRDVISECIKKAEPSIETKKIDYRREYDYRRYGDGGYLGTGGCGSGYTGPFDYKVEKEILNIKLYVEWMLDSQDDGETVFNKLTS